MAQRLLRIVVPQAEEEAVEEILGGEDLIPSSSGVVDEDLWTADVVVPSEGIDPLLDTLQDRFEGVEGFRILVFPLAASIPREEEAGDEADDGKGEDGSPSSGSKRISREELYVRVRDMSEPNLQQLTLVALSAVIACVGVAQDSAPVIVGAMIIAPILGPSMALSLATTLADFDLGKEALWAGIAGLTSAIALSAAWGWLVGVDYSSGELISAVEAGFPELVLALASGVAGALAMTSGVATAIVGVMVAVALLPPTAAAGMLFGAGLVPEALEALTLVASNLICINLAAVMTFLAQGVRPRSWWEEERARAASWIAISLWAVLLGAVIVIIARLG